MFVVCEIQGKQYQVEPGKSILVDRIDQETGSPVAYESVLSVHDGDGVKLGTPFVPNMKVEALVEAHMRGKKIRVFKRRRRKNSKNLKGFRHDYTQIKITKISQ